MGCPGCLISEKELQLKIESVKEKAREQAKKDNNFRVICQTDDKEVFHVTPQEAKNKGLKIIGFISHL